MTTFSSYRHWRIAVDSDQIAWLSLDKADSSTNTLSGEVLAELAALLAEVNAAKPRALAIRSGKESGFIAGADVEEFTRIHSTADALAIVRRGWDAFNKLAALPFPTLALVNGFCLGGGLELALACRYRIALDDPKTKFALPEVMLGILPGWGGVKRLPRLIGPSAALDLLLSGRGIDARRALSLGLVDACVPQRVADNAVRTMLREAPPVHRPGLLQRLLNVGIARPLAAHFTRKTLAAKARREHYPAPYAIVELWAGYDGDPFAVPAGDPASIGTLASGTTAANLIRVFQLQERLKGLGKESGFQARHVHVVGAGTMGGDIAAWCALRGLTVSLQDQSVERIAPAIKRAASLFQKRLREAGRVRAALDRLVPDPAGHGARQADVVIEAIFENLEAKRALFAKLEPLLKPEAVLASNTSSLKLADIGAHLANPARLIGLHFFNPVAKMQLVEVVSAAHTDVLMAKRGAAFVRAIERLPLPVKDTPGFLVNRVLGPYLHQAFRLVDEGLAAETVDAAALQFGMPMGPIELADTVGLDICLAAGQALAAAKVDAPQALKKLVAAGYLGRKSGRGFYAYRAGAPVKGAAGAVTAELIERLITPLTEEARACVAEGIVADADLVDAGVIFGTGFAPFTGGPLNYLRARS